MTSTDHALTWRTLDDLSAWCRAGAREALGPQGAPLLVLAGRHAFLLDSLGTPSGPCPGCLYDGIIRSRSQRRLAADALGRGEEDGWGPVVALATQLALLPLAQDGSFRQVRVIDRDNLSVSLVPVLPSETCSLRHDQGGAPIEPLVRPPARPADGLSLPYRRLSLDMVAHQVGDAANPFCSSLGLEAVTDLEIETTAKVSGAYVAVTPSGCWTGPWGGHTPRFSRSAAIGLLEALERRAGMTGPVTAPGVLRGTASELPVEAYLPSVFGIDAAFDTHPIAWSTARRLSDGAVVAVPRDVAFYGEEGRIVQDSSNGCACGGTLAEAVLFGLLEAVERDAFLISWYGALELDEIRSGSVNALASRQLLDRMRLLGQRVRFFDATVGTRVPTVVAVAESSVTGSLCFGAGAHPDAERALAAALNEVASDYLVARTRLEIGREHIEQMLEDFDQVRVMEDHADLFTHPGARPLASFLLDAPRGEERDIASLSVPGAGCDVMTDLRLSLELLRPDYEVLVVEQTLPAQKVLGVRSVKVIVPGLVPIDFGWRQQRALSMPRTAERAGAYRRAHADRCTTKPAAPVPHPFP